jgi:cation:H+ antiporter
MLAQIILSFAIGVGAILVASRIFLALSQEFSARWRLSPLFVAVVVVAFSTTLPELTVTIASIIQKDPGLALGNVVGSSITNLALIFGLTTLFGVVKLGTKKTQISALILAGIVAFFLLLQMVNLSGPIKGALLLIALGAGLFYEYLIALNGRLHEDKNFLKSIALHRKKPKFTGIIGVLALLVSVAGLGVGGIITVRAVEQLSDLIGLSTTILGLGLNSLATTLPELTMAVAASRKQLNKVVVGTLVGSNIFNLTLFPALVYFFTEPPTFPAAQLAILCVTTLIFVGIIFKYRGKVVPLIASLLLIAMYLIFVGTNFGPLL